MNKADVRMAADLGAKAGQDAIGAVIRTAQLAPTPDIALAALRSAMLLLEAKCVSFRQVMGTTPEIEALVSEMAKEQGDTFVRIFAEQVSRRFGE
jgi:hypothetical protein